MTKILSIQPVHNNELLEGVCSPTNVAELLKLRAIMGNPFAVVAALSATPNNDEKGKSIVNKVKFFQPRPQRVLDVKSLEEQQSFSL